MAMYKHYKDGVDDLTMVSSPSNNSIRDQLANRFGRRLIYTNIGDVLIACNPFERLPIYSKEFIEMYSNASLGRDTSPHIYALAESAYRRMLSESENQAVIISGESGAGKTECAKLILNYISSVSGDSENAARVKGIIQSSNPIMESFGNAKTVRNDNSSRFGKYLEIQFNQEGDPIGGVISNFLLEKTRVAFQQKGERNFHILYYLLAGATEEMRTEFGLMEPEYYTYLNRSGMYTVDGQSDAAGFNEVYEAMQTIGLSEDDIWYVNQILAGILWTGNITFQDNADPPASIVDQQPLEYAAYMFGIEPYTLEQSLTHRQITSGSRTSSVYMVPQNADQATAIRDALAKEMFSRVFDYLVAAINRAMSSKRQAFLTGILDIYGFEIFENNSFEQFCINYVNEKLQQIFIDLTVKSEQEEYHNEGLKWKDIQFNDNIEVVKLLENKKNPVGLFHLLDDVCRTVHSVDSNTADMKLNERFVKVSHPSFASSSSGPFTIKHYAGDVTYDITGFCFKNNDNLFTSLVSCIQTSNIPFISALWPEDIRNNKSAPTTSSTKIRASATKLVASLRSCTPHYIRCIKSNDKKQAMVMNNARVLHQVKYLGLLENVKVRRSGFAYRNTWRIFVNRYKILLCEPRKNPEEEIVEPSVSEDQAGAKQIIDHISKKWPDIDKKEFTYGNTKIFVSTPETIYAMEEHREEILDPVGFKEKEVAFKEAQKKAKREAGGVGEKKKCLVM